MTELEAQALNDALQSVARHDARNKLAAVRNAAFFLKRKTEKTALWAEPRVADFFHLIEQQLDALEATLSDALPPPAAALRAPLGDCIDAALAEVQAPAAVQVTRALPDDAVARACPTEMTLALRCLVENAFDAMPAGGTLHLSARRDGARVVLSLADTGPGFTPERLEAPFKPFASTRPPKAGLGLCVARRLARRHGGELHLRAPGTGAVVELELPFAEG